MNKLEKAAHLYSIGLPTRRVGAIMGVSGAAISVWLKKARIPLRGQGAAHIPISDILQLYFLVTHPEIQHFVELECRGIKKPTARRVTAHHPEHLYAGRVLLPFLSLSAPFYSREVLLCLASGRGLMCLISSEDCDAET